MCFVNARIRPDDWRQRGDTSELGTRAAETGRTGSRLVALSLSLLRPFCLS